MKAKALLGLAAVVAAAAFLSGALGHDVWAGILAMTAMLSLWRSNVALNKEKEQ